MKLSFKKIMSLFLIGFCISSLTVSVFAGTAQSSWRYYGPASNIYYKSKSIVESESWGIRAIMLAEEKYGANVPTGYMGVCAWLYKDDELVESSGWKYNSSYTYQLTYPTLNITDSGDYYADGLTKAYHGSGYYTYSAYSSPILQQ